MYLLTRFQGWHAEGPPLPLEPCAPEDISDKVKNMAPYLARINAILKHRHLALPLLNTESGTRLSKIFEEVTFVACPIISTVLPCYNTIGYNVNKVSDIRLSKYDFEIY